MAHTARVECDSTDLGLYKKIVDVQYLASMNPTAGSFTINERVQRHFATISCSMPESGVLKAIYGALLDGHFALNNFSEDIKEMSESLVQASIFLHQQVRYLNHFVCLLCVKYQEVRCDNNL